MKFLAFIMAIIVLALSCMPCADAASAMMARKAKTEITKTPVQQHPDTDTCSPFCQCTCCAGFTLNYGFYTLITPANFTSSLYSDNRQSGIIEISLPVWQPPQLL
ncbi:DUF6660 family protein [Chitinophaga japonensis]|uniref:Uncharacterized protein n=1 Tax=Chitinophaga japonensis TaxID=104662 RepID=A0A562SMV5_CHIJA|nr:DUF6660 family protein [Chitinophaga japonensis]TWI82627.1 hypothetical protein LX66_5203 [Chitinophaga japonensis]